VKHRICEYRARATAFTSPPTVILKVMEDATEATALDVSAVVVVVEDADLAMCMAKNMGNAKEEIRWDPTEFCCLHSFLLPCKSKSSAGFANIMMNSRATTNRTHCSFSLLAIILHRNASVSLKSKTKCGTKILAKLDDDPPSYPAASHSAFSSLHENISSTKSLFARPKRQEMQKQK
jgi:hypothetical protein